MDGLDGRDRLFGWMVWIELDGVEMDNVEGRLV